MSAQTLLVVEIAGYLVAARVLVKWFRGCWRDLIFATLNIAALYLFFFRNPAQDGGRQLSTFMTYLVVVVWQFVMFRLFAGKKGRLPWLAFFAPILVLILVRYVPAKFYAGDHFPYGPFFIGISY